MKTKKQKNKKPNGNSLEKWKKIALTIAYEIWKHIEIDFNQKLADLSCFAMLHYLFIFGLKIEIFSVIYRISCL